MIVLNNLSKTYVSQTNQEVKALQDVNFCLPNRGMVFILGKSGSGKSTLLNLLGGLDSATSGEIVVDGVSMKNFKQTDYDGYRNGYVGFIFQEYNLLDEFNVKDNVALALQLSKGDGIDGKVVDALRQVELNEDYLLRRVGEMSGGEKQRVAIARSIVKDSKMILADEPTGNLDSATGESIWNILKKLSESKLVVVVSHDRESAEKYADRVIEIADGRVIADSGTQDAEEAVAQPFEPQHKRLSLRVSLKMGVNSMFQRKAKAVSIALLSLFCLVILLFCQMFVCFTPEKTVERFIKRNGAPYFTVKQQYVNEYGQQINAFLQGATLKQISQNSAYVVDGVVENKQQLLDFGFTFVGNAMELDDDSYYVTKYYLETVAYRNYGYYLDGDEKVLLDKSHTAEFLVGKRVYMDGLMTVGDGMNVSTLAGVVDTDGIAEVTVNLIPPCFTTGNFNNRPFVSRYTINDEPSKSVAVQFGDAVCNQEMAIILGALPSRTSEGGIITKDSKVGEPLKQAEEVALADDEIILTYELFEKLFIAKGKSAYTDWQQITQIPEQLGEVFSLKLCDPTSGEAFAEIGEYKLAGISLDHYVNNRGEEYTPSEGLTIGAGRQVMIRLSRFMQKEREVLIKTSSVKDVSRFLKKLRNDHACYVAHAGYVLPQEGEELSAVDCADFAYSFEDGTQLLAIIFAAIGAVLLVIFVLMVVNLITFSITDRKREIGILSALGTPNGDVIKIFLFETLLISVVTFAISLVVGIALANAVNAIVCAETTIVAPLLMMDFLSIAVLVTVAFVVPLLAALIPIRKVAHLKPIDAIRDV